MLTFGASADEQWPFILELIAAAPDDDDRVFAEIAAGPLEGFLGRFDAAVIDLVEAQATADPKFRRVLCRVWRHRMSAEVWERVQKVRS
jgi:hypothetical protein